MNLVRNQTLDLLSFLGESRKHWLVGPVILTAHRFFVDLAGSVPWLTAMNLFALDHCLVWLGGLESPAFQVVGGNNVVCVMPFNGRTALRFSALGAVRPVA